MCIRDRLSRFAETPVISLPGNPISTLVSFRTYVAPLLGHAPEPILAPLACDVAGLEDKEQFLRGAVKHGAIRPIGGPGSHLLAQGAQATHLIRIPAGATLRAGELAAAYPL